MSGSQSLAGRKSTNRSIFDGINFPCVNRGNNLIGTLPQHLTPGLSDSEIYTHSNASLLHSIDVFMASDSEHLMLMSDFA